MSSKRSQGFEGEYWSLKSSSSVARKFSDLNLRRMFSERSLKVLEFLMRFVFKALKRSWSLVKSNIFLLELCLQTLRRIRSANKFDGLLDSISTNDCLFFSSPIL